MKKFFVVCSLLLSGMVCANAQLDTHVGAGVGLGTPGISIDASATLTDFLGARVGVNIMPQFKYSTNLDLTSVSRDLTGNAEYQQFLREQGMASLPTSVDVEGKLNMTTWHVLFDVYPFAMANSFHVTVGAYFGNDDIISVYNQTAGSLSAISNYNQKIESGGFKDSQGRVVSGFKKIGAELGNYFLEPTETGDLKASIKVKKFRPYVGLGIGRAVPKARLGFQMDLGVQFWGRPEVYAFGRNGERLLTEGNTTGDAGRFLKTMSKITVYPVLKLRLTGRIF